MRKFKTVVLHPSRLVMAYRNQFMKLFMKPSHLKIYLQTKIPYKNIFIIFAFKKQQHLNVLKNDTKIKSVAIR